VQCSETLSPQTADEPWNTNQLYIHCAIETDLLTTEGTNEIQQQNRTAEISRCST
jgi:hypothetical protein